MGILISDHNVSGTGNGDAIFRVGEEVRADLPDAPEARIHGALTAFLITLLDDSDLDSLRVTDLAAKLNEAVDFGPIVRSAGAAASGTRTAGAGTRLVSAGRRSAGSSTGPLGPDDGPLGAAGVLVSAAHQDAARDIASLEQQPLRAILGVIEAELAEREAQDDPWPEGRLNAGIAYAAVGDYVRARELLQDAVDIFSGRGIRGTAAMAT